MAEADEGIDLWRVSGGAGKAREAASKRGRESVTSAGRRRWSRSPRPPWLDRESDGRSLLRRDPRLAHAESGNRGGDGAEKRTPGFPVGSESEEGQGGSGLVYVSWSVWARGDARWALLCWSRTV